MRNALNGKQVRSFIKQSAGLALLCFVLNPLCWAGSTTIEVNLANGKVTPEDPVVGVNLGAAINVVIIAKGDVPEPKKDNKDAGSGGGTANSDSTTGEKQKQESKPEQKEPAMINVYFPGLPAGNDVLKLGHGRSFEVVFMKKNSRHQEETPSCKKTPTGLACVNQRQIIIHDAKYHFVFEVEAEGHPRKVVIVQLEKAYFVLDFSGGFSFFNNLDDRYILTDTRRLQRVDNSDDAYYASAFVHYNFAKARAWALTAGLSTALPSTGLGIVLGGSYNVRGLKLVDHAHLIGGLAYVKHKALNPDYEKHLTKVDDRGNPIAGTGIELPTSLTLDNVMEDKNGWMMFFGVSFNFWDGNSDRFKTIYNSSASSKQKPAANKPNQEPVANNTNQ